MKKYAALFICLCLVLSFCGCADGEISSADTSEAVDAPLTLSDDYVIIRDISNSVATTAATSLYKSLSAEFSVKVKSDDAESTPTDCEILIGRTGRPESVAAETELRMAGGSHDGDYIIKTVGKKAVIFAFSDDIIPTAVTAFFEAVKAKSLTVGNSVLQVDSSKPSVTMNGVPVSAWNFVLPQYNTSYYTVRQLEMLGDKIYECSGQHINIVRDNEAEYEYEVIIGEAERDGALTADSDSYEIKSDGKKIYIGGGKNYSLAYAVGKITDSLDGNTLNVSNMSGKYVNGEKADDYRLVFTDEFDTLDTDLWKIRNVNHGNGERTESNYKYGSWYGMNTARSKNNVFVSDGNLYIKATYDESTYYGAKIDTSGTLYFTKGYAEISARLADGDGLWHDFWIVSASGLYHNEFDVVECPGPGDRFVSNVHEAVVVNGAKERYNTNAVNTFVTKHGTFRADSVAQEYSALSDYLNSEVADRSLNDEYHTFGCDWTDTYVAFYFDGTETIRREYAGIEAEENYSGKSYIILSMLVGSNYKNLTDASRLNTTSWYRYPDKNADFWWNDKSSWIIDYLQIFQKDGQTLELYK